MHKSKSFYFKDFANKKNELYLVFKLKENVYEEKVSFKDNVYEREQVLRNVSVFFMCRKAPSESSEENPTLVGDPDYLRG